MSLDARILLAIYGGAHGSWALPMTACTLLGEGWTSLALLPLLAWPRTRRFAGILTAAILLQAILVKSLKGLFGRVRPWIALGLPAPIMTPHDPSFPSGHAAGCFCVAAFLAVGLPAAWPERPRHAQAVVTLAALLAMLIALSRVYLGAHFPGDVLVGALLGALVGALGGSVYARGRSVVECVAKKG
jgi:membrane-associated phospholipid phosphatase